MKNLGLIINPDRKGASIVGKAIIEWCLERGCGLYIEERGARGIGEERFGMKASELLKKVDLIVAIGGDGTMLHAAHFTAGTDIPILGINLGSLGFLTQISEAELNDKLDAILRGDFEIEKRMLVEGRIPKRDLGPFCALNDISINMGSTSRVITFEIFIEGEYLGTYSADGVVVATPTGSTAYSLSAGGPIINPEIDALILTPICPHALAIRPMIIPPSHKIKVVIKAGSQGMVLTIDGQESHLIKDGDEVSFGVAKDVVHLIRARIGFYELVRRKLGWGGLGGRET
jgi:NAD+ kinase